MNPLEVPHKPQAPASANGVPESLPLQRAVEYLRTMMPVPVSANGIPSSALDRNAGSKNAPSLVALLQALRRRWLPAVGLGLLAAAVAVVALLVFMPVRYTVSRVVQIHSKPSQPILYSLTGEEPEFAVYKANQAALIKSPMVLNNAVESLKSQDPNIARDPGLVKWLETNLKTDFLLGPEMLKVALSGDDPQRVADLLNAVVDSFVSEDRENELKRRNATLDLLEKSKKKLEETCWKKHNAFAAALHLANIDDDAIRDQKYKDALQAVIVGQANVLAAKIDQEQAQQEKALWERKEQDLNRPDYHFTDQDIDIKLRGLPQWKWYADTDGQLRNEIQNLESERFLPGPELANKIKDLDHLTKKWKEWRVQQRPEIENDLRREEIAKVRDRQRDAEGKIVAATRKKEIVEADLKGKDKLAATLNPTYADPMDVQMLREEVKQLESAKTKVGDAIHTLRSEPNPPPRAVAWDPVKAPTARDMSRQLKFGVGGGFVLFLLTVFGVGYLELRSGKIAGVEELTNGLNMNVLGTLPSPRDQEAVDAIRTVLLHTARNENVRVIMVASPGPGEGKTSLASQLAASLARAWRNTLLIDGDLRNPGAHKLFNLPLDPGLSEVLRSEANANDVIKPTSVGRLWLMPAGNWDAHATEALAQDNVKTFFDTLKRQYEFIIVDSSAALPFADALSLGQNVDAVLYAVRREVTRLPQLQAVQQRLAVLNVRTLGAVFLGAGGK